MSTEEIKPITVKKLPLILNRGIMIKKGVKPYNNHMKLVNSLQKSIQEDIIYEGAEFTSREVRNMTIVNQLNVLTKSSRTVAKCHSNSGQVIEKTSDEITKLIGQNNYNILFSSLCSIINQELKIRSINALLTVPKKSCTISCQTETSVVISSVKKNIPTPCETSETISDKQSDKPKRRLKKMLTPYVIRDGPDKTDVRSPKRVVIAPQHFNKLFKDNSVIKNETTESLPELGSVFDDDSNSVGRFSSLSVTTIPDLYDNPLKILNNVDKHTRDVSNEVNQHEINATEQYTLHSSDSAGDLSPSSEKLPFSMQEMLHKEPPEKRIKMLLRQGLIDWKNCLFRDKNGHLLIHVAVLMNDVDLLRRQCFVLKMRGTTVDVPADGLTPLRMSLFQENTNITSILLHFGADPLDTDDDDKTAFHIAAELPTDHLQILLNYCQQNARKILHENEDLWKPDFENKTDEELAPILLTHINKLCDNQGYSPLMLASKVGKYNNVLALVESSRSTVNLTMPNSGSTALYLAVGAACMDAGERGNKAKIMDHFKKTVEILVENGADPNITNFASFSVNDLLTEFNIAELSMIIANKLTSIKYFDGQLPNGIRGSDFMLVKDDSGKVNLKEIKEEKGKRPTKPPVKAYPIILGNVPYKPPVKVSNPKATTTKPNLTIVPGSTKQPVKAGSVKARNSQSKQEKVNVTQSYTPLVKNLKLNKPLIVTSEATSNKRKLDIVVGNNKNKKVSKNY